MLHTYIKLLSLTLFSMQEIKYTYSTEAIRVDKTIIYGNRISMLAFDVKKIVHVFYANKFQCIFGDMAFLVLI